VNWPDLLGTPDTFSDGYSFTRSRSRK